MDEYVHQVIRLYDVIPQRRAVLVSLLNCGGAALSVILNYTEGYARQRKSCSKKLLRNILGSLKESSY